MDAPPSPDVVQKALRKALAAIEGSGFKGVAFGGVARVAWGSKLPIAVAELLLTSGEAQRETIRGAVRGEGLQQIQDAGPLSFRYTDAKLGGSTPVELLESSTPLHKQILSRVQPGAYHQLSMSVPTCEDTILLLAASPVPADREGVIELLRGHAGRIDAAYIKQQGEANGIFDKVKSAWQEAKQRG
ncbi:MAG TPA: hypothetical protein VE981_15315 [Planctomycetota bacterium]|nr:hypothetical protein [Planctomycetota bacterium]